MRLYCAAVDRVILIEINSMSADNCAAVFCTLYACAPLSLSRPLFGYECVCVRLFGNACKCGSRQANVFESTPIQSATHQLQTRCHWFELISEICVLINAVVLLHSIRSTNFHKALILHLSTRLTCTQYGPRRLCVRVRQNKSKIYCADCYLIRFYAFVLLSFDYVPDIWEEIYNMYCMYIR